MSSPDTTLTSRVALVAKIAANAQAWNELNTDIQNDIAAYGCGSVSEYRYQTLDGIYIRGLNLRDDLRELDAAAAASKPAMVQQQAQLQQADASKPAGGPVCEACGRPLSDPESVKAGIGPICRSHGHTRRQMHFDDLLAGADYTTDIVGDVICIEDLDRGGPTVTNAAVAVIQHLAYQKFDLDRMPVIYRDSQGTWDEMIVRDRRFVGFAPIGAKTRCEALEIIAKRRIAATPVKVMSLSSFLAAGANAFQEVARIETDQDERISTVTFPRA